MLIVHLNMILLTKLKNILILRRHGIMAWLRCLHHQSSYLHHIQHQIQTVFHETDHVQSRISQKCTEHQKLFIMYIRIDLRNMKINVGYYKFMW